MSSSIDYRNAVILAPMVRVGTLPMRLLALEYGADIVYSEEIIDHKILKCRRVVNDVLGTVDFVDDTEDVVVFRTCAKETDKVVFQIGTSDPHRALKAAKMIENDIAAIDINMGCPKEFSIKGGMGAALLSQPEKIKKILMNLVKNISKPITCKIRILPELQDTIDLCKAIESTGVAAIAIHGRTKEERPRHSNHNDVIKTIASILSIPVIANGGSREISEYKDIQKFQESSGASAVMLARTAQWNCSIFRREGKLPMDEVIKALLKYAVDYENHPLNTKYGIQQMFQELQESPVGKALLSSKTLEEICCLWDMGDYCRTREAENKAKLEKKKKLHLRDDGDIEHVKRSKMDDSTYEVEVKFIRHYYKDHNLPKTTLLMWTRQKSLPQPKYETEHKDKLFKCVVTVNGNRYTPVTWYKNKRTSEQAAALACLHFLTEWKLIDFSIEK